ncbi:hypothetical protein G4X40_00650 [Rhodococcus sp. D2-41]|uniref:hypothetical protein n=1 Tax=Speluncibacter jeojiensis TaxID=2710754 RepID=UPI002410648B|nr:hypothetical protein [Rhodococcus sp. D2-41]MDG3008655.1 hypothetical protein [Rhodococcus sp. D2-41]
MNELPAERLARQITERHGRELDAHRSEINEQLADFRAHGRLPSAARRLPSISARSFEAEDIELDLAIGVREAAQFGSIRRPGPAPDDFDWVRAGVGGTTAYPQKLAPTNDDALRSRLDSDGDVLPAAHVSSGCSPVSLSAWGLQVLSTLADELTLAAKLSHRTYVWESCQLDGEALTVRYRPTTKVEADLPETHPPERRSRVLGRRRRRRPWLGGVDQAVSDDPG